MLGSLLMSVNFFFLLRINILVDRVSVFILLLYSMVILISFLTFFFVFGEIMWWMCSLF